MTNFLHKPYAESCDQNRLPILNVIRPLLIQSRAVLEIGSGTGQHAVFFAAQLPHLIWYPSDRAEHHAGIQMWVDESGLPNVMSPLLLDVSQPDWSGPDVDAVFSANTAHIMHWPEVEAMFAGVGKLLPQQGLFMLYGAFNYQQRYTSESNALFDARLKARDPQSGIRHFEDVNRLAHAAGLELMEDYAMPVNNRLLFWRKY